MRILLTVSSLSSKSGGPSAVVQNLSEHLASLGQSVSVLTNSAARNESEILPRDKRVKVIHAASKTGGSFRNCLNGLLADGKVDLVHDFGLWLPSNHAASSACHEAHVPFVCSPSGMLASWALRHKRWKKRIAWWLYQHRDLSRSSLLAATSIQEFQDIRTKFPTKPIASIPNGVEIPPFYARLPAKTRRAVFLGRIHPVKGLKNLIEAWNLVNPEGWRCTLAGPDEGGHQKELEALLASMGLKDKFEFPGLVEGDKKWSILNSADLFLLPSFTENFGISAAEALACAVPVITTKGTPWKVLVDNQCGWWVDIGVEPLAKAFKEAISLSEEQRRAMGLRGRKLMEEQYSWSLVGRELVSVYGWILARTAKPACVTHPLC